MIKGLDNLDEYDGAGSDDQDLYEKLYIDLPHSANPGLSKSINISIKGELRRDKYMHRFIVVSCVYLFTLLFVDKLF